jgi:hypothetical protein
VQAWLPRIVHRVRNLQVERGEQSGSDRDGHRHVRHREDGDRQESRENGS